MSAMKINASGRVQGVGFRRFVHKKALSLGLHGYVSNLPNGDLEVFAQGSRSNLIHLLNHIKKGPFLSKIHDLTYTFTKEKNRYQTFSIITSSSLARDQTSAFTNLGKSFLKTISSRKRTRAKHA